MKKNKTKLNKTAGAIAVLLLSCALLLSACSSSDVPELLEPVGAGFDSAAASYGTVSNTLAYFAEVLPASTDLYFSTSGTIKKMAVYKGQSVKKGDLLVELDQDELLSQLEDLQSQLEELDTIGSYNDRIAQLNIDLLNLQRLECGGDRRKQIDLKIEAAELALKQAIESRELNKGYLQAEIERIEKLTSETLLYAPCSGTFYCDDSVREGAKVSEFRTFAYIFDPSDLSLVIRNESMPAEILDAGNFYGWVNGTRYELEYVPVDEGTALSLSLEGKIVPTSFKILGAGKDISAGLTGAVIAELSHVENVLVIPSNALFYDLNGMFVYVITGPGTREKRYVTTGVSSENATEITEGLSEGDVVYVQE